MRKIIRPTYPREFSIGLLLLIFIIALFLSGQIFEGSHSEPTTGQNRYLGMFLASLAVLIMVLILWEEFLFPVKINLEGEEVIFRNHRTKLKIQALIYLTIPLIFGFIYFNYELNEIRFYIWAAICMITPVAGKLISGINNYNDFLKLSDHTIAYKNNAKTGTFEISHIRHMTLVKDERNVVHKIRLTLADQREETIDLDEMELEAFFDSIDQYVTSHYPFLLR